MYLRKNIVRTSITGQDGNTVKGWNYDEAALTKEEYKQYLAELAQPAVVQAAENSNDIMAAVAEIYEQLTEQYNNLTMALADIYESTAAESEG